MRKALLLVPAVLLVGLVVAYRLLHVSDLAPIGAGYVAQQTCACLFVSGRSLESCRGDLDPLARTFVSVTAGPTQVKARSFMMASASARYEKGYGCSLEN